MIRMLAVPLLFLASTSALADGPEKCSRKEVLVPGAATSPFSAVVRGGDQVYVAGTVGLIPGTRTPVPGGIGPETKAALESIFANLAKVGLGPEDVAKCTVFLTDIADFAAMNAAYTKFFPKDPPARTSAAVAALVYGARVEIECIAVMRWQNAEACGGDR
jgi:2-iminobutanoate/2-iminopropanoate deaminase